MQDNWQKFTDLHGGKHFSRDVFVEFCAELLDKHFPGKDIVINNNFSTLKSRRNTIVYLSKFIDSELNSSRKGQIRNSFNSFIKEKENSKQKVYAWVVCMPYVLNEEELKWWLNWIEKQRKSYSINIELLDGNYLIELANKYDLYKKWFTATDELNQKEEVLPKTSTNEVVSNFELIEEDIIEVATDDEIVDLELIEDKIEEVVENNENTHDENNFDEDIKNEIEEIITDEIIDEKDNLENTETDDNNLINKLKEKLYDEEDEDEYDEEITEEKQTEEIEILDKIVVNSNFAQKLEYDDYYSEFIRLKEVAEKLTDEQKEKLVEINSNKKNWSKTFDKVKLEGLNTLQHFYKAKSKEVHREFASALYVYENILYLEDYKDVLKNKISEISSSIKLCKTKTIALLYEFEGDLHYVRGNIAKATIFYEKAYNVDVNNQLNSKKYFETLGDNQIKNDIPEHAFDSYSKAINFAKLDKNLKLKQKNAKHLKKGKNYFGNTPFKIFNVFFAPLAYMQAYNTIKEKSTKNKLDQSLKRFYFAISLLIIALIIIFFAIKKNGLGKLSNNFWNKNKSEQVVNDNKSYVFSSTDVLMPISPAEVAFNEGSLILDTISYNKIHLIDTAISAFNRSLTYTIGNVVVRNRNISFGQDFKDVQDTISYKKYNEAKQYKTDYLTKVQSDILDDSAAHFISMRRYSEGLRLFKYTFEPHNAAHGKYGFVDSLMNIVVPPLFDFDFVRMYSGKENFNDGIALICLVSSKNDTTYYFIDKNGRKIR